MSLDLAMLPDVLLALAVALIICFCATPIVKMFAQKVGAIDDPSDERRVHDHPIPRMGGLAIFLGFILSVVLFVEVTAQIRGILLGAIIIVVCGAIDDVVSIRPIIKLLVQILAAVLAIAHGVVIEFLMNPNIFLGGEPLALGVLAIPVSIVWIVAITNSVNLIDGLDGLAVGVSAISSATMLVIALLVPQGETAIILAALVGACLGFMPYNLNPAKIFMGDTGSLLLGYVLATVSVLGLFKFYAIVSFVVPMLALALPIFDTVFAFLRRLIRGQNPMKADRGHFHHRLMDLGLNQKQAVAVLYSISALLGLAAVLLATSGEHKLLIMTIALIAAVLIGWFIMKGSASAEQSQEKGEEPEDRKFK